MGIMQRFKGKIQAQVLVLGTGGIVDGASGIGGRMQAAQRLALSVTAVTNTDVTMSVPPGATIESIRIFTTTAFTSVTDTQISVGNAAAGAQYAALTSIKALGIVTLTLVNSAAAALASAPNASPNLFIRIQQSGGNTAVGAATLVVSYLLP